MAPTRRLPLLVAIAVTVAACSAGSGGASRRDDPPGPALTTGRGGVAEAATTTTAPTPTTTTEPVPRRRPAGPGLADVVYADPPVDDSQRLDLFLPPGDGPHPVVVWVHGGGWAIGRKEDLPPRDWTARGWAMASVDYRLAPESAYPATLDDVRLAVEFLAAHGPGLGIDPTRIAVVGSSAGGQLAALAALTTDVPIAAVVSLAGPNDLTILTDPARHELATETELLLDCPAPLCPDRAAAASPVTHVRGDAPPFLIVHGTADRIVPPEMSIRLHRALRAVGAPSTLRLLEGEGHDVPLAGVDRFLSRHL